MSLSLLIRASLAKVRQQDMLKHESPLVQQFLQGLSDGPVPFHFEAKDYAKDLLSEHSEGEHTMIAFWQRLGKSTIERFSSIGRATSLLLGALFSLPNFKKGTPLLIKQLYSVGFLSLIIIIVSGLFIGMVLALQGYTVLQGYGAEGSLGPLVALSLLRELGPVVTALLVRGPCGQCADC